MSLKEKDSVTSGDDNQMIEAKISVRNGHIILYTVDNECTGENDGFCHGLKSGDSVKCVECGEVYKLSDILILPHGQRFTN